MFEMRLCLALGKTRGEVRAMSYQEFRLWQYFYMIEPWGFADREYRTSALLAQMHNVSPHVTKRSQMKKLATWMRDMPKEVLKYLRREVSLQSQEMPDLDTAEGKTQATESVIRNFELMFGKRFIRKDKK